MTLEISEYRIKELLQVKDRVHLYSKVLLNLNSLLSTMLYEYVDSELEDSKKEDVAKYMKSVQMLIIEFLTEMDKIKKPLVCYFSLNEKFLQNETFDAWYKQMRDKVKYKTAFSFYKKFVSVFQKLANDLDAISCVDTKEVDPYLITHMFGQDTLIISRDEMDLLGVKYGHHIFNGREILTKDEVETNYGVPIDLLKYVMALAGVKKRDWGGIRGFGKKKSAKYIKDNLTTILDNRDEKIKNIKDILEFFEPKEYYDKYVSDELKKKITDRIKLL